jgi:uncharacterized RDD family membrane protein YckC
MQWYFAESGRQVGPVDEAAFRDFVASGRISSDTLVWREGMANWQPYGTVAATPVAGNGLAAQPGSRFCSECGRPYPLEDLAAFGPSLVCASCKPIYTQRLREGVMPSQLLQYGGFWIRFLAVIIDGLILSVVSIVYSPFLTASMVRTSPNNPGAFFVAVGLLVAIGFVVRMAYETWFVGRYGATPGKMVCRLKVVRPDGRPLTYMRSWCRFLAKELDNFTLLIGYIIAAFDDEKRALHDRICDTRVIRA